MKVLIAGGSGFLGTALGELLKQERHEVFILTRQTPKHADQIHWDGRTTHGGGSA